MTRLSSAAAALVLAAATLLSSAAPPAQAAPRSYVALGDSYAAGVGAGSYEGPRGCRRSAVAHPALWAAAHHTSRFSFRACAKAGTAQVRKHQLSSLRRSTSLVSITVGANDAGFAHTLQTCALRSEKTCLSRIKRAARFVHRTLPGRLDDVYEAIDTRAPRAQVIVLGYPRLYRLGGRCLLGFTEKARRALNGAADDLNEVTAKRAADHGFTYGDVRTRFSGHEICSKNAWIRGLSWPIADSYHPTAAGQSGGYYPVLSRLT